MGQIYVFMAYLADLPCFAPQTMTDTPSKQSVHSDGTILQSDSSSIPSYEETGTPVEVVSPLGYHVDWISVIFLVSSQEKSCYTLADGIGQNVSRTIGIGVFTTRELNVPSIESAP